MPSWLAVSLVSCLSLDTRTSRWVTRTLHILHVCLDSHGVFLFAAVFTVKVGTSWHMWSKQSAWNAGTSGSCDWCCRLGNCRRGVIRQRVSQLSDRHVLWNINISLTLSNPYVRLYSVFPAMEPAMNGTGRTASEQAGFQAATMASTLAIALVGGLITGWFLPPPLSPYSLSFSPYSNHPLISGRSCPEVYTRTRHSYWQVSVLGWGRLWSARWFPSRVQRCSGKWNHRRKRSPHCQ